MAEFDYVALDSQNRNQSGSIEAANQSAAAMALRGKGLRLQLLKERKRGFSLNLNLSLGSKVKNKDLVIFTRQFATMINAGVPMVKSLSTLQKQTEAPAMQQILNTIVADVEGGTQLSVAMAKHPKAFSSVYINMIKAGEEGGILDQIMERLATQVEKDAEMKGKLKSALIYPGVITLITIGAFVFIMTGIIPKLAQIFDQFEGELPLQTKLMLGISDFMVNNSLLLISMIVVLIVVFIRFIHTKRGKFLFDALLLKVPVFGPIVLKVNVARFARTFSSLAGAGVAIVSSLEVTSGSLSNTVIKKGILDSVNLVRNGQPIADALAQSNVFPGIIIQMTAVGEETGQVDVVLDKIAEFYEKEVDRVVAGLSSIIEPLLIVMLGGMVGLIVASVFGPIASITQNV